MNIHEVAKRLRKLGIPGREKEKAIKRNLIKKEGAHERALERYLEKILVRWAHTEGVIDPPKEPDGQGRGKTSDWPPQTIEQAAAVWAVRDRYRTNYSKKKGLSKNQIAVIKLAAKTLDDSPFAIYKLPPITGPLSMQSIDPESIDMTFISEDCSGLNLFPGRDSAEKAECLNELVVAWVAAREKVRAWASAGMSATYIVERYPHLGHLTSGEVDFSQIDPWQVDVPCPWRIDRKARVALRWWSKPSKTQGMQFGRMAYPVQRTLSKSDRDEIFLYENGVDTRAFFTIEIGDRHSWARAEREKIDFEQKRLEHKLQSLGVETIDVKAVLAMEERPFEKLTAREKAILKTVGEMTGLAWRRAQLNSFGEE